MLALIRLAFGLIADLFRSRAALEAEILVLRQQIIVLAPEKAGTTAVHSHGQVGVGLDLPAVSQYLQCPRDRTARDCRTLAPRWLSVVLALEVERLAGSPCPIGGNPQVDPR